MKANDESYTTLPLIISLIVILVYTQFLSHSLGDRFRQTEGVLDV